MRTGRWTGAVFGALVLAVIPGALHLAPAGRALHRVVPVSLGALDPTPPPLALTAPPSALPDEVPIIPPDDSLSGELAPVRAAPVPFEAVRAQPRPGEVFALIIGINDYPGSKHDLGAAVADADVVDEALARFGVPPANRAVLRDGQARRSSIVSAARSLVATAGPGSTIVFAYAGHVRKLDRDTEAIVAADGGLVRDDELAALFAPSTADGMWFLLATCYAGGFTELLGPGRILTAAADANSLAYESPSINGSYLVHHLVREGWLQGKAGPTVQEAFAYADARINQEYPARRPVQVDGSNGRMQFGHRGYQPPTHQGSPPPPPGASPSPSGPPPTYPPNEPERCFLLICR